jgi:hypothetical protein
MELEMETGAEGAHEPSQEQPRAAGGLEAWAASTGTAAGVDAWATAGQAAGAEAAAAEGGEATTEVVRRPGATGGAEAPPAPAAAGRVAGYAVGIVRSLPVPDSPPRAGNDDATTPEAREAAVQAAASAEAAQAAARMGAAAGQAARRCACVLICPALVARHSQRNHAVCAWSSCRSN